MNIMPVARYLANKHQIPKQLGESVVERKNPCSFCRSDKGYFVSQMDYWDLVEGCSVRCKECGLIQLDPMPTNEELSKGCTAFYLLEKSQHGMPEVKRTCQKNYRKGLEMGLKLKAKGKTISRSLELGAGDAYFSKGLKSVFPDLEAVCLDTVPEVIEAIEINHGFKTICGVPEELDREVTGQFDLIAARDLLEHVTDPLKVIQKVYGLLRKGGFFHFTTPNGHEDIWRSYAHQCLKKSPTELLINHLNYFPPKRLCDELENCGFSIVDWYIYDFKGFRKGKGYQISEKVTSGSSSKRSASETIKALSGSVVQFSKVQDHNLEMPFWTKSFWLSRFVFGFLQIQTFKAPANIGLGHEIYALLQKEL